MAIVKEMCVSGVNVICVVLVRQPKTKTERIAGNCPTSTHPFLCSGKEGCLCDAEKSP